MFSNTHSYIAEKVYSYLKDYNGIVIDKTFFKYGSIKPDYAPRLVNIGHYAKDSMDFVLDEMKYLSSLEFIEDKNFIKKYSIRLGVIIHFLSDYFCHAHNNTELIEDILKHIIYEAKLENSLGKFRCNEHLSEIKFPLNTYKDTIAGFLNNKLENYKQSNVSHINDLKYAIEASYGACLYIITASLNNSKSAAA